jgi:hypothetical protein
MTEPTTKLTANAMISTLLEGGPSLPWKLQRKKADGTREEIPYRMQVLRVEENLAALKDAQDTAKTRGEVQGYGDIYKEAQAHEVLLRAIRTDEKHERPDGTSYYPQIFSATEQLRASLTELEMAALLNAYQITKSTFAVVEGLEGHDAESWIERLSDPLKAPFHLSELDSAHWPALILLLARLAAGLLRELGREPQSSAPSSESEPETSTSSTGSSGPPPSALNTGDEPGVAPIEVSGDTLLSAEDAAALVAKRKGGAKP